jgi:DNA-binding MarR family transcriptional regulator
VSRTLPTQDDLAGDVERLQQLLYALGRRHSLRDPIASTCEDLQFTPPQVHTLLWLGKDGMLTMGELARRLGVTEKTVTGVVDRLEREGHVQRERVSPDRRVVSCRLTETGQQTSLLLDHFLNDAVTQILGLLDGDDRKALFRIMEKLVHKLDASSSEGLPAAREKTA